MKHEKDEVLKALTFLDTFSTDKEYKDNLTIVYDYFTDLVDLVSVAQEESKKANTLLLKMVGEYGNRQGRRKLQKISQKL